MNSFLQFLEQDDSGSLIVGATNHPNLLDRALFRRFDAVVEYTLPSPSVAEAVMRSRLALLRTECIDWAVAGRAAGELSHAEIVRACEHAAKNAILAHTTSVGTETLVNALAERQAARG